MERERAVERERAGVPEEGQREREEGVVRERERETWDRDRGAEQPDYEQGLWEPVGDGAATQ